jgi:hypothetical protein
MSGAATGGMTMHKTYRKPALVRQSSLASATALKTISGTIKKDSVT